MYYYYIIIITYAIVNIIYAIVNIIYITPFVFVYFLYLYNPICGVLVLDSIL